MGLTLKPTVKLSLECALKLSTVHLTFTYQPTSWLLLLLLPNASVSRL
jgi:hypothetical protein